MASKLLSPVNIILVAILSYFLYNHYKVHIKPLIDLPPVKTNLKKGQCELLTDMVGCEDIKIAKDADFALLACGKDFDFKKQWGACYHFGYSPDTWKQKELDKFYHFNLDDNQYEEIKIKNLPKGHTLDLHGIDIVSDPKQKGQYLVYAINHMRNISETVEKFKYNPKDKELTWFGNEFGREGDLVCPNSLTILDSDNYIVSNHAGFKNKFLVKLQFAGLFRGGPLTHFTSKSSKVVYNKINKSNGITLSKDGKLLFVASTAGANVEVFKISKDKDNGYQFDHIDTVPLTLMPDNLNLDSDTGDIYAAGFPRVLETVHFMENANNWKPDDKCSFRVNRIKTQKDSTKENGYKFEVDTVLEHDGSVLSMATVAAPYSPKNKILLGSVFARGVLNCQLNN